MILYGSYNIKKVLKKTLKIPNSNNWHELSDEQLLNFRIKDLGLKIEGSILGVRVRKLYSELKSKGIHFHPQCYLTDEWLSPDGIPIIGMPFYLAHSRLSELEKKMMLEVEGGSESWCLKLLRHEAGHAINYAYKLYRKTRWRELFGSFSTPYVIKSYSARPYSKYYVTHLEDNYAQSHPDEDFAETFAVWLNPQNDWKIKYKKWPVMKKLLYVDHLMNQIKEKPPIVLPASNPYSASRMRKTLQAYYNKKRAYIGNDFPGYYDAGLCEIFTDNKLSSDQEKASKFLRKVRKKIISSVSRWTGQRKYDIHKFIQKLIRRSDALNLYMDKQELESISELVALITSVLGNVRL